MTDCCVLNGPDISSFKRLFSERVAPAQLGRYERVLSAKIFARLPLRLAGNEYMARRLPRFAVLAVLSPLHAVDAQAILVGLHTVKAVDMEVTEQRTVAAGALHARPIVRKRRWRRRGTGLIKRSNSLLKSRYLLLEATFFAVVLFCTTRLVRSSRIIVDEFV